MVLVKIALIAFLALILWGLGSVTNHQSEGGLTVSSFLAVVLLVFVWVLAGSFALLPAISLYSPEHRPKLNFRFLSFFAVWNPSKSQILGYVATSYAITIYLFAVMFLLANKYDAQAFTPTIDGLGTAAYFSIVTIATVGYGDIQPVSSLARLLASAEILFGVTYTVFFFSVIAGFLREQTDSE
jgi:voltage-gated potassium channel Kch